MAAEPDKDRTAQMTALVGELVMGSELTEMARLPVWVAAVAAALGIRDEVKFAINLCLEEIVSNSIRHGYEERPGQQVRVGYSEPRPGYFVFTVEDDAAPFDPLAAETLPKIGEDPLLVGGQGIRLVRGFAESVEYEARPRGNRVVMGFGDSQPG